MATTNLGLGLSSPVATGGVAHKLDTTTNYTSGTLLSVRRFGTQKFGVGYSGAVTIVSTEDEWAPQITLQYDQAGEFTIFDGGSDITREAVSSGGFPEGNVAIFRNNGTLKATRNIIPSYVTPGGDFAAWVPEDATQSGLLVEWGGEGLGIFGARVGEAAISSLFKVRITGSQSRTESYVPILVGDPTVLDDGVLFEANYDTGTTSIVPVTMNLRSLSDGAWDTGVANPFAAFTVASDDENNDLDGLVRGGLYWHMDALEGNYVGAALRVGTPAGRVVAQTWNSQTLAVTFAGAGTFSGALGATGTSGSWIGHTTALSLADGNSSSGGLVTPVLGIMTSTVATQLTLGRWSTNATQGAAFGAVRSKAAAPGTFTALAPDDVAFTVFSAVDDGTDLGTRLGDIRWEVDDQSGTVGASQVPGRLIFRLAAGLAPNDNRIVGRFSANGVFIIGVTATETGATTGGIRATGDSIIGTRMSVGGAITSGAIMEANSATGSSSIVPNIIRNRTRSNGGGWLTGSTNFWGAYDFYCDDATSPPGPSVRGRLSAHMEAAAGDRVGLALFVGPTAGPTLSQTWNSDLSVAFAGSVAVTGAFGCNGATAQTAAASGGALAAYGAGANGLDSGANMSALHALVVAMRAALVANGIMS